MCFHGHGELVTGFGLSPWEPERHARSRQDDYGSDWVWIADRQDRLAIAWPREKTAGMLIEKHEDTMLKLFDVCPFVNLSEKSCFA